MDIWTDANRNRCRDVDRRIKDRLIDKWRWADKQTNRDWPLSKISPTKLSLKQKSFSRKIEHRFGI